MKDQAEHLRAIIAKIKSNRVEALAGLSNRMSERKARVITITSGKGGVGKTNIAANLAILLSSLGKNVAIIDADLGLANVDVLLGIIPRFTLLDVINNTRNIYEVLATGPGNIKFISGGSGVRELIELDNDEINVFLENISLLDKMFDIVLIDTGAGISDRVTSFVMAADEVILVTTPEPTSITDAYALIKTVSRKEKNKVIKVIVNRVESEKEANDIQNKLKLVSERFLGMKLLPIGYIARDESVVKAVKSQQPFVVYYPNSRATKQLKEIAMKLLEQNSASTGPNAGLKGFIRKFISMRTIEGKVAE